ncbi:unnamed protein product, partial [Staurois parvus]
MTTSTQLVWLPPASKAETSRLPGWSPPDSVCWGWSPESWPGPPKRPAQPVQSARWLLPKYGPRIGDFIPSQISKEISRLQVPKQALPTKEEIDKPVSSAL